MENLTGRNNTRPTNHGTTSYIRWNHATPSGCARCRSRSRNCAARRAPHAETWRRVCDLWRAPAHARTSHNSAAGSHLYASAQACSACTGPRRRQWCACATRSSSGVHCLEGLSCDASLSLSLTRLCSAHGTPASTDAPHRSAHLPGRKFSASSHAFEIAVSRRSHKRTSQSSKKKEEEETGRGEGRRKESPRQVSNPPPEKCTPQHPFSPVAHNWLLPPLFVSPPRLPRAARTPSRPLPPLLLLLCALSRWLSIGWQAPLLSGASAPPTCVSS